MAFHCFLGVFTAQDMNVSVIYCGYLNLPDSGGGQLTRVNVTVKKLNKGQELNHT